MRGRKRHRRKVVRRLVWFVVRWRWQRVSRLKKAVLAVGGAGVVVIVVRKVRRAKAPPPIAPAGLTPSL